MREFIDLLFSFLVFLFPVGLYCLGLSYLNRSRRPILVSGVWDGAFLLFALSGFLLLTVPRVLDVLVGLAIDRGFGPHQLETLRSWVKNVRLGYFLAVALGAAALLILRRRQTGIYNVDVEQFPARLEAALAELGLDAIERSGRLIIAPAQDFHVEAANAIFTGPLPGTAPAKTLRVPPGGASYAELRVDFFTPFCYVTLHWDRAANGMRQAIEQRLTRTLEGVAALDNPASGWFLGFSALTFSMITVLALFFVVYLFRLR